MITGMTYYEFLAMLEYVFDRPYNWLLVDWDKNLCFQKFNQSIINNNSENKNQNIIIIKKKWQIQKIQIQI